MSLATLLIIYVGLSIVKFTVILGFLNKGLVSLGSINDTLAKVTPTTVINNVTSSQPKPLATLNTTSEEHRAILKDLASFKDPKKEANIKLNLEGQTEDIDINTQDALKFLKKNKED
jgi:hypothetical protein